MNTAATFVRLVIVVGLVVVDAPPSRSRKSHTTEGDSRSRRHSENQACRRSNVDGTITVWVPPTSDDGDYIIAWDLDTGEKFELYSNDPVSEDLTICVHRPSGWYLICGNLTRRIEIRHSTQDIVYHSGRIDKITQCEDSPCGENLTVCGYPRSLDTLQPSVSTSPTTLETNSVGLKPATGLRIALVLCVIGLVLCGVLHILLGGIFVWLYEQYQKIRSKSGPEETVPQHIREYCMKFPKSLDFQRRSFKSIHFECGIIQYMGEVHPLYVYEGKWEELPKLDSLPNGFMVPKAGNDDNPGTLQVYSMTGDSINDLERHLYDSHCRGIEHKEKIQVELNKLEEENKRLTLKNSELNFHLQQLKQTRQDELNKLEEENKRLTLKNSKLDSRLQQLEQAGLQEKRSHKVLGGNHDQRFLENWEKVKLPTSEQQIEESKEESALLFEEAQNNAPEQSDPSSFTDEFGSQDHPYVQEDH